MHQRSSVKQTVVNDVTAATAAARTSEIKRRRSSALTVSLASIESKKFVRISSHQIKSSLIKTLTIRKAER